MFQRRRPRDGEKTSLYAILGVGKDSDKESISRAYKKLALVHHPDKGGHPDMFRQIVFAHEVLKDEERRRRYDKTGSGEAPGAGPTCNSCGDTGVKGLFGKKGFGLIWKPCRACSLADEFAKAILIGDIDRVRVVASKLRKKNLRLRRPDLAAKTEAACELLTSLDSGDLGHTDEVSVRAVAVGLDAQALSRDWARWRRKQGQTELVAALHSGDAERVERSCEHAQGLGVSLRTVVQAKAAAALLAAFVEREETNIGKSKVELLEALSSTNADHFGMDCHSGLSILSSTNASPSSCAPARAVPDSSLFSISLRSNTESVLEEDALLRSVIDTAACGSCSGRGVRGVFGATGLGLVRRPCESCLLGRALRSGCVDELRRAAKRLPKAEALRAQAASHLLAAFEESGHVSEARLEEARANAKRAGIDDDLVLQRWEQQRRQRARVELDASLRTTDAGRIEDASVQARAVGMDAVMIWAAELLAALEANNEPLLQRVHAELLTGLQGMPASSLCIRELDFSSQAKGL